MTLTVASGKQNRAQTPVCVPLSLPREAAEGHVPVLRTADGRAWPAQLTAPGLRTEAVTAREGCLRRDLHFLLPALGKGETVVLRVSFTSASGSSGKGFSWRDTPGQSSELRRDGRLVLRYMYPALDDSTKENRELTYKVFHHLFEPSGKGLITKGAGGKFTHHRGLFYGFRKTTYGSGQEVDTWHCTGDTYLGHEKFLAVEGGPVLGRHRVQIGWHGKGKERFAVEERELTVFAVPGGQLVEFASRLTPVRGTIKLDGDPQHSGFHFRASNEVAEKTTNQTYFLRPHGKGQPGQERNWPQDKAMANLPWNAMSFVAGGQRYTAAYLDRPDNPKEARYSERTYGRFGSYFVAECSAKTPLIVAYRLWLQEGEMTAEEVAARSADFVEPLAVTVKSSSR